MSSYETKIVSTAEVSNWVMANDLCCDMKVTILLGGDRIVCCDEAVGIFVEEQLAGVATIAPKGESGHGMPDIVGVFIAPQYRGNKFGVPLLEAAVHRCLERGFDTIVINVMSAAMKVTLERIDPALRAHLKETHHNMVGFYVMDLYR